MTVGTGGHAVVAGGGIGGLAVAIGLRRIGWEVTLLERALEPDDAGAGISLQANGLSALDALGVGEQVRAAGERQRSGGIRTPSGAWLSVMDVEAAERLLGSPVHSFHRARLHRALRAELTPGDLVTGARVVDVTDQGERAAVTVERQDGSETLTADLVVGADGLRSRVRAAVCPHAPGPVYSGATAWRAVTPPLAVSREADIEETWGRGGIFGVTRLPGGAAEWHALADVPAGGQGLLDEVRARFGAWQGIVPAALEATAPDAVVRHEVWELRTPLPTFVRGRVALLGDAAHAMTPHLGQGASQALEDAATLAALLRADGDVAGALVRYDALRRPRTQAVARASRSAGRLGLARSGMGVAMRNAAIRTTPARVALRQMVKHASWTAPAVTAA